MKYRRKPALPFDSFGHRALMAHRDPDGDKIDFFPTPPWAARAGAELVKRFDPRATSVWEPACGAGHGVHGLRGYFPKIHASDAYAYNGNAIFDFTSTDDPPCEADWVFTNPPFAHVEAFIRLGYARARRGVALLMRAAVLESIGRHDLLTRELPLAIFAPFSERVPMHRARWEPDGTTAAFYAWFIWVKPPLRRPARQTVVQWIAPGAEARLTHPDDARMFGAVDRSKVTA